MNILNCLQNGNKNIGKKGRQIFCSILVHDNLRRVYHMNDVVVGCLGLWHLNLCWLFNAKSIFIQIICSISNNSF